MLCAEVRRALDRHAADDDIVDLADLLVAVAPEPKQVKAGLVVHLGLDAEPLVRLGADDPRRKREPDVEHAAKRLFRLLDLALGEPVLEQGLATAVRCTGEGVGAGHIRDDVRDLRFGVSEALQAPSARSG